jgi:hypothetical protein
METAQQLYNQLNSVDDIRDLLGKEENLFLEVKRAQVPISDADKANLAIALSGFANSSGGVLIFGLFAAKSSKDDADIISKEEPIKNVTRFLPEVQSLIGQAVVPTVDNAQAKAIIFANDPSLGYVVIVVPESDRGPHRAVLKGTKQYYKRSGDSFYAMEHFDLADMFGKRRRSNLKCVWRLGHISFSSGSPHKFAIIIALQNEGRGLARYPLFTLTSMRGAVISDYGVDGNRNHGLPKLLADDQSAVTFAGGSDSVIHPGTTIEITALGHYETASVPDIAFKLTVAAEDFEAKTLDIEIKAEKIREILQDTTKRTQWFSVVN